jgi:hypothetical protein
MWAPVASRPGRAVPHAGSSSPWSPTRPEPFQFTHDTLIAPAWIFALRAERSAREPDHRSAVGLVVQGSSVSPRGTISRLTEMLAGQRDGAGPPAHGAN